MDLDLDKLIDSLTKQQQRKSDLELAIRKVDARKKTLDGEVTAMKHKEESLQRQIPELKKEISGQKSNGMSLQADLQQIQNACCKLVENVDFSKMKFDQLQESCLAMESKDKENLLDTVKKLENNLEILKRAGAK